MFLNNIEPPQIFFILWSVMIVSMVLFFYVHGKKSMKLFPDINSVKILFREKRVSGNSMKSWKTKLGGAQNILDIIITEDELWIKSPTFFAWLGEYYDLRHRVSLKNIISIDTNKNDVTLIFQSKEDTKTELILRMKKSEEFEKLIKRHIEPFILP